MIKANVWTRRAEISMSQQWRTDARAAQRLIAGNGREPSMGKEVCYQHSPTKRRMKKLHYIVNSVLRQGSRTFAHGQVLKRKETERERHTEGETEREANRARERERQGNGERDGESDRKGERQRGRGRERGRERR